MSDPMNDFDPKDENAKPTAGDPVSREPETSAPSRDPKLTNLAYVLIAIGALLLISRFGWFDWGSLWGLLRYWPVLVIAAGVDMLTGGRRRALVYGAGVAAVLLLAITGGGGLLGGSQRTVQVSQPLLSATSAEVRVSTSVAKLELTGSAPAGLLASGSLDEQPGERVNVDYEVSSGRGVLNVVSEGRRSGFMSFPRSADWRLSLSRSVPLALTVDTGVSEALLDLSGLTLESLNVNIGVGQTTVLLPRSGSYRARIDGGVGETVLRVPRDLAVAVRVDTGVGRVRADEHFAREGDTYTSPAYASPTAVGSDERVQVTVDAGVGEVRLEVIY